LHAGDEVDGFRVVERLHSGGMGHVYAVEAPVAGPPLVMKVPRIGPGEPASSVISYETELTVLRVLRGPHAPRLIAAGDLASHPYLVLERVDGTLLKDWVARAPLPADEVARLGLAVATALHALHQQDAIHLDVKPSNVIIRPSGEAVLIDFGIARHAHHPDLLSEESHPPAGSAPYVSPEQLLGDRSDPRSDTFALGVVLYELATGRLPFGSPATRGALRARMYRDPLPPRAGGRPVPEWLQEVILRCLEPRPRDRYATAAQVAFDLSHPDQVAITDRGRRTRRSGALATLRRWIRASGFDPVSLASPSAHLSGAPIVMVAIATARGDRGFEALRAGLGRVLVRERGARVACVTVVRPSPALGSSDDGENAAQLRLDHLRLLRAWAEPLRLAPEQLSLHVLESNDPVEALVHYARVNRVDHVVIGAPPRDMPASARANTVAMRVASEAPCTVTLARAPGAAAADPEATA
jgi:nucleotide-binding universal stress UspA family protein